MDSATKTKIAVAVAIAVVAVPLWFFSDGSMQARVDECWEKAGGRPSAPFRDGRVKDPLMADRLYKLAWIYRTTYRPDQMAAVCHDWLIRYGGDDREWPDGQRLIPWEASPWNDETNIRPDYYPKESHPLTAKILAMYGDYFEKQRLYTQSDPCWFLINKRMQTLDPETYKQSEVSVLRIRTRSM